MLNLRKANTEDAQLYFDWANEEVVRLQSFNSEKISLEDHIKWFKSKIADTDCIMLMFEDENKKPAGQVRFQKENEEIYVVGISVDIFFRGKGLGIEMLKTASNYFFELFPSKKINAFIKQENIASINSFEKAGYNNPESVLVKGILSLKYTKENNNANS